ncbi:GFA family protein [Pleomorphomonas carboxyditropha]|uniref:Aldehyde-activating protein n=1 Tax=Pleomorphomonas carboxyditropha TaxID=2023338 RepID=A0A2G9X0P5_9HYPH|nr:GFA family protein [Pleomorphomonas carboxyditropha]PIP00538.1 aldehyde-activating protein [Pleomorphomonas carboxyditropha]
MPGDTNIRTGRCHCGAVHFEVALSDGFSSIRRCNCSYCRMRGAVVVMAEMGGVNILKGEDMLTTYRFNTRTVKHFFCSRCGIYTHHQRRSDPNLHAVNVACLDGVSPFDFSEVPVMDGINHTNDTGKPTRRAGTLRYVPSD